MPELTYSSESKEYRYAKEELTKIKVQACMKALNAIGAVPIHQDARFKLEEELFSALEWF